MFLSIRLAEAATSNDARPLLFGVLNQQSPILTAERWNPILRYLSAKTGIPLRLQIGATVEITDAMMAREEFDLLYSNHNFQTAHDGKYKVIARWAGDPIRSTIVVPADSPARTLDHLRGYTVAFPSPDAFVGYAVPALALRERGITVTEKFASTQEGALALLKAGQADAAAVNSRFLAGYVRRERLHYRVIYESGPYLELPVLAHPRLPSRQVELLKQALLGIRGDPSAASVLQAAHSSGFVDATDPEYDNVRRVYKAAGR